MTSMKLGWYYVPNFFVQIQEDQITQKPFITLQKSSKKYIKIVMLAWQRLIVTTYLTYRKYYQKNNKVGCLIKTQPKIISTLLQDVRYIWIRFLYTLYQVEILPKTTMCIVRKLYAQPHVIMDTNTY